MGRGGRPVAFPVGFFVSLSLWALGFSVWVSSSFLACCVFVPSLASPVEVLERLLWTLALVSSV